MNPSQHIRDQLSSHARVRASPRPETPRATPPCNSSLCPLALTPLVPINDTVIGHAYAREATDNHRLRPLPAVVRRPRHVPVSTPGHHANAVATQRSAAYLCTRQHKSAQHTDDNVMYHSSQLGKLVAQGPQLPVALCTQPRVRRRQPQSALPQGHLTGWCSQPGRARSGCKRAGAHTVNPHW